MTAEEIAVKLAEHENRIKVSEHRIKDVEDAQKEIRTLTLSVHEMAISLKNVVEEQKEQRKCLDALEAKPGKRWEKASDKIIDVVISGIVGAILATLLTLISLGL